MKNWAIAPRFAVYLAVFLYELVKANFQVVKAVLSPRFRFRSAAIRYQARTKTQAELILLATSITLTPGTLSVDAKLDKHEILIHVMSADTVEQIKEDLYQSLEKKLLWALRGVTP